MKAKLFNYDYLEESLKTLPVSVKILEIEWLASKLPELYMYLE